MGISVKYDSAQKRAKSLGKVEKKGKVMVGRVGLEPTANGLKGRCSTIELPTQRPGSPRRARNLVIPFY